MQSCENMDICCYIENVLEGRAAMRRKVMRQYCEGGKSQCARYMVKRKILEGYMLPEDECLDEVGRMLGTLRPTETAKARRMVARMVH